MPMLKHEFQFQIDVEEIDDRLEAAVLEAGCDDTSLWSRNDEVFLAFYREAPCLADALRSALDELDDAGIDVIRIMTSEVSVTSEQMAANSSR